MPTDFIFFLWSECFLWSEFIRVKFYFIFIFLFDPSWSESIRVDPTRTGGPSWSGPTFVPAFRQVYNLLYKILPTSLGTCKPTFYTFYTSHLRWNSTMRRCFYHTDLGQNAVFHNFAIQIALIQYSGRSKPAWAFTETVKKISKITYTVGPFSLLTNAKVDCLNQD